MARRAALTRPPQLPSATATVSRLAFNFSATEDARVGSSTARSVDAEDLAGSVGGRPRSAVTRRVIPRHRPEMARSGDVPFRDALPPYGGGCAWHLRGGGD